MGGCLSEPSRPILRYHGGKWRLAPNPACAAAQRQAQLPMEHTA